MAIYLGANKKSLPFSKIYLGNKIKYKKQKWILKTGDYLPKMVEGDFSAAGFASKNGITITYGNASNVSQDCTGAWKAFDTDTSTYWSARHAAGNGNSEDGWVVIDCGANFKPSKVTMKFGADATTGDNYFLYASEDNINWDLVWSISYTSDSIYATDFNINFEETSKVYRYLRPTWENPKSGIAARADFYNFQILEWYEEET